MDYYQILGIAPNASPEEIKKAFRKLSKEKHPDITHRNNHDEFALITQAYDVLSNPTKRTEYDSQRQPVSSFVNAFFTNEPTQPKVLRVPVNIDIKNLAKGASLKLKIQVPVTSQANPSCPKCHGTGHYLNTSNVFPSVDTCDCITTGNKEVEIGMRIPAGTKPGDQIILQNHDQTIPYQQFLLVINTILDEQYSYDNGEIVYTLPVTTVDLMVGTRRKIPVFDKKTSLNIPAGTNPNKSFTVTNEFYPQTKIKVVLDVSTPKLNTAQKTALKNLMKSAVVEPQKD